MLRRGASLRQDHALRRCREPAAAPAQIGLAASFSRPGGNVTGIAQLVVAAEQKRLELLHKLVPTAKTIACLVNPTNPNAKRQVHDPVHARKFPTVIMADPKSFAPQSNPTASLLLAQVFLLRQAHDAQQTRRARQGLDRA